jgi:hypothetical protein
VTRRPRLYLDEDVHAGVASGLRRRGYDVLTTVEARRSGTTDAQQLEFASSEKRCLFSFNRGDFARLHAELLRHVRRAHLGVPHPRGRARAAAGVGGAFAPVPGPG